MRRAKLARWALVCALTSVAGSLLVLAGPLPPTQRVSLALLLAVSIGAAAESHRRRGAWLGWIPVAFAAAGTLIPSRGLPSNWTAINLACLGLALILIRSRYPVAVQILAAQPVSFELFTLLMALCRAILRAHDPKLGIPAVDPLWPVPFALTGLALLCARPHGIVDLLTGAGAGSRIARRIGAVGLAGPLVLVAGAVVLVRTSGLGLAHMALTMALAFCAALAALGLWMGYRLNRDAAELTRLRGALVTMCAWTKRIRDGDRWVTPEVFLSERFGIAVTHGIAPEAEREFERQIDAMVSRENVRRSPHDIPPPDDSSGSPCP